MNISQMEDVMRITNEEKRLLDLTRKLESPKCREDLVYQAEAMVRAQEALKMDYGLIGADLPLFNGVKPEVAPIRTRRGSTDPVLA
jgi:hypothetical protein